MRLWRPVGPQELALIEASGWRAFPPRLPDQPVFYPVLNFDYAEEIARDWNSARPEANYLGYVLEFDVDEVVAARYPPQTAGAVDRHVELWVPAEELENFNAGIVSPIRIAASYRNGARVED